MGPQSYNIFTNDMLFILDHDVDIYNHADDNTVVCYGDEYDSVKHTLLQNVNNVISWFKNNSKKVNHDKYQCIVYGRKDNLGSLK